MICFVVFCFCFPAFETEFVCVTVLAVPKIFSCLCLSSSPLLPSFGGGGGGGSGGGGAVVMVAVMVVAPAVVAAAGAVVDL